MPDIDEDDAPGCASLVRHHSVMDQTALFKAGDDFDCPAGRRTDPLQKCMGVAGVAQSGADYILFTDADIEHPANSLRHLVSRAEERKFDLVSRMAKLHCSTPAEKLLIPAFVFFFMML